jgi:hypothetical protein
MDVIVPLMCCIYSCGNSGGFREQDQQRGKGDGDGGMASDVQEPSGLPLVVVEKLSSG